jgi:hypothetical protein
VLTVAVLVHRTVLLVHARLSLGFEIFDEVLELLSIL